MPTIRVRRRRTRQKRVMKIRVRRRRTGVVAKTSSNTRRIAKIERAALPYCPFFTARAETLSTSIHTQLLTAPNSWTRCFRTHNTAAEDIPRQYFMRSMDYNWLAQTEDSTVGNLMINVFLVSLVQRTAAQVIARTTRRS